MKIAETCNANRKKKGLGIFKTRKSRKYEHREKAIEKKLTAFLLKILLKFKKLYLKKSLLFFKYWYFCPVVSFIYFKIFNCISAYLCMNF